MADAGTSQKIKFKSWPTAYVQRKKLTQLITIRLFYAQLRDCDGMDDQPKTDPGCSQNLKYASMNDIHAATSRTPDMNTDQASVCWIA